MAKPNYSFEKRQREMAKKKKKEEKLKEKAGRKSGGGQDGEAEPQDAQDAQTTGTAPADGQTTP